MIITEDVFFRQYPQGTLQNVSHETRLLHSLDDTSGEVQ